MNKTGGEIVVDYLIREGVEYVIGIPGHGCLGLMDAVRDRVEKGLIKFIQVKQEMAGIHMADGYFRATGKPLAMITSIGPGALNTAIGLATSYVDSTAVMAIIGDVHTYMRGTGVLQEIDRQKDSAILSSLEPLVKRCWKVDNVVQLPRIMQRAFNRMLSDRKGPVAISIPMDVQCESIDVELPVPDERKTSASMFPDPHYLEEAFSIMKTAKRPVILAGGGFLQNGEPCDLVSLAEIWGAAVVTTMAGKSSFPEDHKLYAWHGGSKGTDVGNYICRSSDVILSLGCRFADETTSSYRKGITYNIPETKLIQVDIDGGEIGKNYPCTVGILGDVKIVTRLLLERFKTVATWEDLDKSAYHEDLQCKKKEWFAKLEANRKHETANLTISQFLQELNKIYPREGILVTSSGNAQAQVLQEYCFKTPGTHMTTGGFSTMGFALPASMGAKLGVPEVPVMALIGDGDFLMSMQEMSTAVQYGIPIILVVINNSGWSAISDLQISSYGESHAFGNSFTFADGTPYSPDYKTIAESFGMYSQRATRAEEIQIVMRHALDSSRPSFIEVIVENKYPFSGTTASGWWDVPVPPYIDHYYNDYKTGKSQEFI
jgi:acetolactate synthase I/II/III large subunit